MRLIYHKQAGRRTDEYTIDIDGKEYFIIATPEGLTIINPDGQRLYLEK